MNRTVITACLSVILCSQLVAHQSAPQPSGAQQAQPQATQPASPQAAPRQQLESAPAPLPSTPTAAAPGTPQPGPAAKKKRSAAKKKATKPAEAEPAVPAPAPAAAAAAPPAAPLLPPTLMNQPPVTPTVTMRNGLLTIDAPNSTLSDVLSGVRQATGAVLEGVSPSDRVAVRLGPGSPRDVVAALLQGTPYDYLILGSDRDPNAVTHIMLTQATSSAEPTRTQQPAAVNQPPAPPPPPPPEFFPDQDNVVTGSVTEGEQPQPPPLPQQPQPVNPNQPWLTMPQQPPAQPQQQ